MAIKEAIELEGSDKVKATIADLTKTVQGLTDQINNLQAPTTGTTEIDRLTVNLGQASAALDDHTTHVNKTTEAYHILHPLLQAVGLQFGELRSFALLANTSLVALAGVGLAAVAIKMSEIQEAVATTQLKLSDLFGTAQAGKTAFDAVNKQASTFGTTVDALEPGLEALTVAYQKFIVEQSKGKFVGIDPQTGAAFVGFKGDVVSLTTAYETFLKILRAGGDTTAQATTQATVFFTAMQNGGRLTAEELQKLPVGAVSLIAQAFGKGGESVQQFINEVRLGFAPTIDQTVQALLRFQDQANKAYDTKAIHGFSEELAKIQKTLLDGFTQLTGIDFASAVNKEMTAIQHDIQNTINDLQALKDKFKNVGFGPGFFSSLTPAPAGVTPEQLGGSSAPEPPLFSLSSLQNFWNAVVAGWQKTGNASKNAASETVNAWKTVGTQIRSDVDEPLKAAGDSGTTFADRIVNALKSIGPAATDAQKKVESIRQTFAGGTAATFGAGAFVTPPGAALPAGVEAGAKAAAAQIPGLPKPSDVNDLTTAFNALKPALDGTASTISSMSETLRTATESGDRFAAALHNAADVSFSSIVSQLQTMAQTFQEILNSMQQIQSSSAAATPATFAQRFGFASGGLFRGRPGIDSNLAWMTDYEYVMQPSAVRKYGVGFLEAINNMLLPLDWFDRLRGYAGGGLVMQSASSSPTPLHLHFPGVPGSFEVAASENVASSLRKHAVRARLFSTGRKPTWY